MGKPSRDKGNRRERELVQLFRDWGLEATRVPLSGATTFQSHDVKVEGMYCEVKGRAKPIATLCDWLKDQPDFVAFKADRQAWLFIVPEEMMRAFLSWRNYEHARRGDDSEAA